MSFAFLRPFINSAGPVLAPRPQTRKTCTSCNDSKPVTEFYLKRYGNNPDLRASVCKHCVSEQRRATYRSRRRGS